MPERYDLAAERHLRIGQHLQERGDLDDAAYHFGVCGENAIKHALRYSGVEAHWASLNRPPKKTPMLQHFPRIHTFIAAAQAEIVLNATGRLSASLSNEIQNGVFAGRFAGWDITIRYANDNFTPVSEADCATWGTDAEQLCLQFLVP